MKHGMKHESVLIETVRIRRGQAPLWGLHLRRLFRSCAELGVRPPLELAVPAGGPDRVHRLAVGPGGLEVTERAVGSTASVDLITASVVHRPYPHKTAARSTFDEALSEAQRAGAGDALLLTSAGKVAECAIWSVFWWDDAEELCTPALELGVLPGVARDRIRELVPVAERKVGRDALDERPLFVANAVRGIVPVHRLDGRAVPDSPATDMLRKRFWG
jgi:branched-subunit amino acid aminotransferase/4-amino-4-deoxychorismate lyase